MDNPKRPGACGWGTIRKKQEMEKVQYGACFAKKKK